jgi:hypothetical protein
MDRIPALEAQLSSHWMRPVPDIDLDAAIATARLFAEIIADLEESLQMTVVPIPYLPMEFHENATQLLFAYDSYQTNCRVGLPTDEYVETMRYYLAAIPAEYHEMPLYRAATVAIAGL